MICLWMFDTLLTESEEVSLAKAHWKPQSAGDVFTGIFLNEVSEKLFDFNTAAPHQIFKSFFIYLQQVDSLF